MFLFFRWFFGRWGNRSYYDA
uniref:Uncharacterized protein n=1 Tax=Rhizophora mucronata TaxID=61149 RepID=A0A2P2QVK8_RHIMU